MVQSPVEPSGDLDERAIASAMQLLAITTRTLCAALLAVAARCALDGATLVYEIIAAVLLAMLLAAVWLRGVGRQLTASARGNGHVPPASVTPNPGHNGQERPTAPYDMRDRWLGWSLAERRRTIELIARVSQVSSHLERARAFSRRPHDTSG
jgi:hypothetical protein